MKRILWGLLFGFFFILVLIISPSKSSASWVKGYFKVDGTYVNGYWKSNPNGLKYDNYSFDGNWSSAYNDSYFSSTKKYSSDWYTPSWITQKDYYTGKNFYNNRKNYSSFDYNSSNYSYDFLSDPIYKYRSSYDYGLDNLKPKAYIPYTLPTPRSIFTPYHYNLPTPYSISTPRYTIPNFSYPTPYRPLYNDYDSSFSDPYSLDY